MKKAFWTKTNKNGWKIFIKNFYISFMHYLILNTIIIILYGILLTFNTVSIESILDDPYTPLILYFMLIAPGINAILHIIYNGTGFVYLKLVSWLHTFFAVVFIPTVIFYF
ncbi:MAG: hypothetical protein NC236_02135 [Mycoplasma sp.]|nr:hypothetical protein [Mycoplasma sp.]